MFVSFLSGPWDAVFGGGNLPAFLVGAVAAAISGVLAITMLPSPRPDPKLIVIPQPLLLYLLYMGKSTVSFSLYYDEEYTKFVCIIFINQCFNFGCTGMESSNPIPSCSLQYASCVMTLKLNLQWKSIYQINIFLQPTWPAVCG